MSGGNWCLARPSMLWAFDVVVLSYLVSPYPYTQAHPDSKRPVMRSTVAGAGYPLCSTGLNLGVGCMGGMCAFLGAFGG
jgi:hypothetical protein